MAITGGAWAYLSAQSEAKENRFSVPLQTIEVDEDFDSQPTSDGWVKKRVRFLNNGQCDCYVRALVVSSKDDGSFTYQFDSEHWSEPDEEGWRYCSEVISPNNYSPYVLEGLSGVDAESLEVYVLGESVQAEGFSSAQEGFEALKGCKSDE